ncbi:hypothetical protein Fot_23722 [Forsythia ovata]|uniref:Uncharacterized protein n=1 Tax=Forsythia ovata TaxID=205694 RepID=A0ABD1U472_9LAMI
MGYQDSAGDSRKAKRGRGTPFRKTEKTAPLTQGANQTSIPPLHGWTERINIESRKDELVPAILEKLPVLFAIAVASVHKYWTSAFAKAADNVELLEMLKLAEMYTSQSHVLNCELYKVLAMKIDELHSTVVGVEDIDELRSKNKILCSKLVVFEDARTKVEYKISMAETIQSCLSKLGSKLS